MRAAARRFNIPLFLMLAVCANLAFWAASHNTHAKWAGVPPVPTENGAKIMTLGDGQFSYRFGAITLQNLGNSGGQVIAVKDYDYKKLGAWFWLLHSLDPASNHVPMIAAYYFGATPVPEDVAVVVNYLGQVGQNPVENKWRWLAHAIFLARHKMNDLPLALDLAYKLSRMEPIGDVLPVWARQMPAFVLAETGEKETARKLVEEILLTAKDLHPAEVGFMSAYLTEQLGVPEDDVRHLLALRGAAIPESAAVPRRPTLPALVP